MHKAKPPALMKCPQCSSLVCGDLRCRFSMLDHSEHDRIKTRIRRAAKLDNALRIDQRKQADYQRIATTLGHNVRFTPGTHYTLMEILK